MLVGRALIGFGGGPYLEKYFPRMIDPRRDSHSCSWSDSNSRSRQRLLPEDFSLTNHGCESFALDRTKVINEEIRRTSIDKCAHKEVYSRVSEPQVRQVLAIGTPLWPPVYSSIPWD